MLADIGARVIVADRDSKGARAVAEALPNDAIPLNLDVADEAALVHAMSDALAQWGVPWLLVNCAGVQDRSLLVNASVDEWDQLYTVNLRGSFLCLREVATAMIAQGLGGRIVNISSLSAVTPMMAGLGPYAATKAGVIGLTQNAALEFAEHCITVNAVLPGGVDTPGVRSARGTPPSGPAMRFPPPLGACTEEDIAAAVAYLASPAAGRISGQSIIVDGGFLFS